MAASYPTSIKSFATRTNGQTITPALFNDPDDEITAIETALLNGIAHILKPLTDATYDLGSSTKQWKDLYLSGALTVASLTASGAISAASLTTSGSGTIGGSFTAGAYGGNFTFDTTARLLVWGAQSFLQNLGDGIVGLRKNAGSVGMNFDASTDGTLSLIKRDGVTAADLVVGRATLGTSALLVWGAQSFLQNISDGIIGLRKQAGTTGVDLDGSTDGTLNLRTRSGASQTGNLVASVVNPASLEPNQTQMSYNSTASFNNQTFPSSFLSNNDTGAGGPYTASITGAVAPSGGRSRMVWFVLNDVVTTGTITFKHESGSSTAANRFHCTTGADISISDKQMVLLVYNPDGNLLRWIVTKFN